MGFGLSRRLHITVASYLTDPDVTQGQLARRFGVSQQAIADRLARARAKCSAAGIRLPDKGRRRLRVHFAQLSACGSLAA